MPPRRKPPWLRWRGKAAKPRWWRVLDAMEETHPQPVRLDVILRSVPKSLQSLPALTKLLDDMLAKQMIRHMGTAEGNLTLPVVKIKVTRPMATYSMTAEGWDKWFEIYSRGGRPRVRRARGSLPS